MQSIQMNFVAPEVLRLRQIFGTTIECQRRATSKFRVFRLKGASPEAISFIVISQSYWLARRLLQLIQRWLSCRMIGR